MKSHSVVWQQSRTVILGQLICCAGMAAVYALLGQLTLRVVWSGLAGAALASLNFFVMALCADIAADKGQQQDVSGGQAMIQFSYIGRMIALFLILVLCAKSGLFELIPLVLPLVFVRPILTAREFIHKKGAEKK